MYGLCEEKMALVPCLPDGDVFCKIVYIAHNSNPTCYRPIEAWWDQNGSCNQYQLAAFTSFGLFLAPN